MVQWEELASLDDLGLGEERLALEIEQLTQQPGLEPGLPVHQERSMKGAGLKAGAGFVE